MPVTSPPKSFLSKQLRRSTLNEHRVSLSIVMPHIFHLLFEIATVAFCKIYNSDCSSRVVQPLSIPPKPALVKIHPEGTGMGVGLAVLQKSISTQIILCTVSLSSFCISKLGTSYSHVSHDCLLTFLSCCYQVLHLLFVHHGNTAI